MKSTILIITYKRDFRYLIYCLRSIEKFATGFFEVCILVPEQDLEELRALVSTLPGTSGIPINCIGGKEWEGKGMLWHMAQVCRADEWCNAYTDIILHFDGDCIFTEPVTPETFMRNGKPILQYESFAAISRRHGGVSAWQTATEKCLPFPILFETMRQHPEVYKRSIYSKTRSLVEQKTGMEFDAYVKSGRNGFPQEFCEFVTLGNVAAKYFPDDYAFHDRFFQPNPDKGVFPVFQAWSHADPEEAVDLWHEGVSQRMVPMDMFKKYGLT